ncbi:MAG: RbsD/FucU domain-containing protein [Paracoccus sp. (in: a-proteobacteria)]|uniref:RbsD/FucU family protein n=1 Tax=Paracoccus sp. TaxID=267 RepID=UPI0026DF4405|nr:RbsD/FucU domain-containing protein [Paracoccus sp. (in: a-proteobacteria)]MDO5614339.1 RbsD/FucU domain-containing protein [Paracoccus sp. (in: a-proteobacteria)]
MLKGIDPLIGPDLLRVLARMGHGDEIVLADANFPAASIARQTVETQELRIDCDAIRALHAVLSLLPLDSYLPDPVLTMQVVGDPAQVPAVVAEAAPLLAAEGVTPTALERFAFYDRATRAFAVLRTAETRAYGNFILRKGVIDNPKTKAFVS